jgi:preprotein translocase subunit SecB
MNPSPLHLGDYFISSLHFSANSAFDLAEETQIDYNDFEVDLQTKADSEHDWFVTLQLKFQPPAESNVPYRFIVEIVGSFKAAPSFPAEKIEKLVKTNGASMLYGILREVVRDTTARGPYPALILPSTSFYEPSQKPLQAPASAIGI